MSGHGYHMCLVVRGALNWPKRLLRNMLRDADSGRSLTAEQARDYLMDQLAQGREVLPMSKSCGNPCTQAGCSGFDYGRDGGCPGYPVDDVPAAQAVAV